MPLEDAAKRWPSAMLSGRGVRVPVRRSRKYGPEAALSAPGTIRTDEPGETIVVSEPSLAGISCAAVSVEADRAERSSCASSHVPKMRVSARAVRTNVTAERADRLDGSTVADGDGFSGGAAVPAGATLLVLAASRLGVSDGSVPASRSLRTEGADHVQRLFLAVRAQRFLRLAVPVTAETGLEGHCPPALVHDLHVFAGPLVPEPDRLLGEPEVGELLR